MGFLRMIKNAFRRFLDRISLAVASPRMIYDNYRDARGRLIPRVRYSNSVCFTHIVIIDIGENVFIWHYCVIDGTGGVKIGAGTQLGAWVGIFTHSSYVAIRLYGRHYMEIPEEKKVGYKTRPVRIGKYTAIGSQTVIVPGVTIGDGCIVCPSTYVNRDIPDYAIARGNPVRIIGDTRHLDRRYLRTDEQLRRFYEEWQFPEQGGGVPL
ncbi:MAG: acyltransferase [Candidatus Omnitrophota bacterium]|nr:acyltransferase [Candidatus Omnitrophota bacterium]